MIVGRRVIRLGLVGAGAWGRNYMRTIDRVEGVCLARLATRNPEIASLTDTQCIISRDWRELVEATDLDALILAVPPNTQVEIAIAALENRLPLLLEKPLATNVDDAERIAGLAEKKNVPVLVDHVHLFSPAYAVLKNEVGMLGAINSIRATSGDTGPFRKSWTPLWDWGPHDVAMCLDLAGDQPNSIIAECEEVHTDDGIGEVFHTKLGFPSGITASLEFGNAMGGKIRTLTVAGDGSEIVYDDLAATKVVRFEHGNKSTLGVSSELALDQVVKVFAAGLHETDAALFDLDLAVQVVRILSEIERQCVNKQPLKIV